MIHEAIVRSSPIAMLLVRDSELVFANPAGAKLLGIDFADEVVGRRLDDWLPPIERGEIAAWLADAESAPGAEPVRRVLLRARDGGTQLVEMQATRMVGATHLGVLVTLKQAAEVGSPAAAH